MTPTTSSRSRLRKQLREGHTILGSWLNSGSPMVAELMASCGFDFLCVDAEHSAVDRPEAQRLFQAIRSGNPSCGSLVRLHGVDYAWVKRFLDAGADGVVAPLVRTAEEARILVQACKYPPAGLRGVGFCRANGYGLRVEEELVRANEDVLVAVQIEHVDAVAAIDSILSVPGIDAVFIGPYDLTASMGIPAQFTHPDYLDARAKILSACARNGIVPGIHAVSSDPEAAEKLIREGYRFVAFSLDITLIATACTTALTRLRKVVP
ncbi:MAG TPA: aldolase/citrate lyase family protein [Opitutaceae bacterium]|nr:aldolase/citrate lyase family protein [Opitutaceae bacterium]